MPPYYFAQKLARSHCVEERCVALDSFRGRSPRVAEATVMVADATGLLPPPGGARVVYQRCTCSCVSKLSTQHAAR